MQTLAQCTRSIEPTMNTCILVLGSEVDTVMRILILSPRALAMREAVSRSRPEARSCK
jgi:hypothetical protein